MDVRIGIVLIWGYSLPLFWSNAIVHNAKPHNCLL